MKFLKNIKMPIFKLNIFIAFIPVIFMLSGIITDSFIDPENNYPWLWLIFGGILSLTLSYFTGKRWEEMNKGIIEFMKIAWFPIFFLVTIGALITIWKANGLIPSIIYYSASVLKPEFLIPGVFIAGAIFSSVSGSSWTTFGTLGAIVLTIVDTTYHDITLTLITAGSVMSGSYFGDRISPISDTTIYPAANSKVDVIQHVKVSLPVVISSAILSFILYVILGFVFSSSGADLQSNIDNMKSIMNDNIVINGWIIASLLLFIPTIMMRINILGVLWINLALGVILLFGVQHKDFWEFMSTIKGGSSPYEHAIKTSDTSYWIHEGSRRIMASDGIQGSLETIIFVLSSLFFASSLKVLGTFDVLLKGLLKLIKGPKTLIIVSGLTGGLFAFMSSDQSVGCNINPTFYNEIYDKYGVNRLNLSRGTDNTATVLVPLMPWSSDRAAFTGRAMAGTSMSSMSTGNYLKIGLFSFFLWFTTIIGLLFVIFDLFQVNKEGKIQFRGGIKSYTEKRG